MVENVDGRFDRRLRMWLRVDDIIRARQDIAARILAQEIDTRTLRRAFTLVQHARMGPVAVVTSRGLLSAGCRGTAKLVIAIVRADYPCRDGTPLFSLADIPPDNYLLRFMGDAVRAQASDGQYFLIRPVSRP